MFIRNVFEPVYNAFCIFPLIYFYFFRYSCVNVLLFKKRYANHKKSFNLINSKNDTTLSMEYWTYMANQRTI